MLEQGDTHTITNKSRGQLPPAQHARRTGETPCPRRQATLSPLPRDHSARHYPATAARVASLPHAAGREMALAVAGALRWREEARLRGARRGGSAPKGSPLNGPRAARLAPPRALCNSPSRPISMPAITTTLLLRTSSGVRAPSTVQEPPGGPPWAEQGSHLKRRKSRPVCAPRLRLARAARAAASVIYGETRRDLAATGDTDRHGQTTTLEIHARVASASRRGPFPDAFTVPRICFYFPR